MWLIKELIVNLFLIFTICELNQSCMYNNTTAASDRALKREKLSNITGDWQLATGDWRLVTGDWQPTTNYRLFLVDGCWSTIFDRRPTTRRSSTGDRWPATDNWWLSTYVRRSSTDNRRMTTNNRPPTTDVRQPMIFNWWLSTDDLPPSTDVRRPKTDDRRPTTDDRWLIISLFYCLIRDYCLLNN